MDVAARIRAVGDWAGRLDARKRRVGKVKCQGCGREICSDEADWDPGQIDYVKTKRGSELFIHHSCIGEVWKQKIK